MATQTQSSGADKELLQYKYKVRDTVSLVFAIIAILLPVPWFDLAFGIAAFVIATKLKKEGHKTMVYRVACVGLVISALYTFLMAFGIIGPIYILR